MGIQPEKNLANLSFKLQILTLLHPACTIGGMDSPGDSWHLVCIQRTKTWFSEVIDKMGIRASSMTWKHWKQWKHWKLQKSPVNPHFLHGQLVNPHFLIRSGSSWIRQGVVSANTGETQIFWGGYYGTEVLGKAAGMTWV